MPPGPTWWRFGWYLESMIDLAIIGAGPIGIEAAILAKRAGLAYRVFEKGAIVDAVRRYPTSMLFFTTSERLEVGGHPLVTSTDKATRKEALDYYRKVVANEGLEVQTHTQVVGLAPALCPGGSRGFEVRTRPSEEWRLQPGQPDEVILARYVVVATGYFDNPKLLGVPGEELPHVSHYYDEGHPHFGRNVVIVGAGSSAADAALDLFRAGAKVTIVHRGDDFRRSLKYWVRPNLENRVKEGSINVHFGATVKSIGTMEVVADQGGAELRLPAERVFLLTGYYAPPELLQSAGVRIDPDMLAADLNPGTFESNVEGLFVIGSAGSGTRTSDVFIENGLVHAKMALTTIVNRLAKRAGASIPSKEPGMAAIES